MSLAGPGPRSWSAGSLLAPILAMVSLQLAGCELTYPEVVVVNQTDEHTLLRRISFNGCLWEGVLALGEATAVARCLPGEDRVHFEKLDAAACCRTQAESGGLSAGCPGDAQTSQQGAGADSGPPSEEPNWFAYQTAQRRQAQAGEFHRFEVVLQDLEQDFSVPGPYGH